MLVTFVNSGMGPMFLRSRQHISKRLDPESRHGCPCKSHGSVECTCMVATVCCSCCYPANNKLSINTKARSIRDTTTYRTHTIQLVTRLLQLPGWKTKVERWSSTNQIFLVWCGMVFAHNEPRSPFQIPNPATSKGSGFLILGHTTHPK